MDFIREKLSGEKDKLDVFDELMRHVRLYNLEKPIVVLSADYGVPQNRERVLFIGCRNEQKHITEIPATVSENDRVKVYEAIWDMDMLGNGEIAEKYKKPKMIAAYESQKKKNPCRAIPMSKGCCIQNGREKAD